MKKLLFVLVLFFSACAGANDSEVYYDARTYPYHQFNGRVIHSIVYCDGCGPAGDYLTIYFTDGTHLKVWAYKYTMRVYP